VPEIDCATVSQSLKMTRLRCFFFFKDYDPTKPDRARSQTWSLKGLRERWYDMDKTYSRAASRVAISQLVDEINILRDPLLAEERCDLLLSSQAMVQALLVQADAGEGSLEQRFEKILRLIMVENGGSAR